MNRRFFLSGLIAAPIVAASPLARFIMPAPARIMTPQMVYFETLAEMMRQHNETLRRMTGVHGRLVGYRLGDTALVRLRRAWDEGGPPEPFLDYTITDIAT